MTCKDCIHSGLCYKENDYENFPDRCGSFIPERQQGKWDKRHTELLKYFVKCEKCGEEIMTSHKNFCPNCGADMQKEGK